MRPNQYPLDSILQARSQNKVMKAAPRTWPTIPEATLPRMATAEATSAEMPHPTTMTQVAGLASRGVSAAMVVCA